MLPTVRRSALIGALLLALVAPSAAFAQDWENDADMPWLTGDPPVALEWQGPPPAGTTPTSASATAAPGTGVAAAELPATGADAGALALAGISLLAFGASLRLQLALRDGRV